MVNFFGICSWPKMVGKVISPSSYEKDHLSEKLQSHTDDTAKN